MIAVFLLYAICASTFTISKWALYYSAPIFFMAARMILAALLLFAYMAYRAISRKGSLKVDIKRDWWLFAQAIFFQTYLAYMCDLWALDKIPSAESAFLYNLTPFITALYSFVWLSERMTFKKWIGLSLGFIALLPALMSQGLMTGVLNNTVPKLITLVAVASSAYGWIVFKRLLNRGYSPVLVNGYSMLIGGFFALITSYLFEPWNPTPVTHWIPFIKATMLIIVVANIIFQNFYGYLLEKYTATFLSFAGFTCPIFASVLGWLFLGEPLAMNMIVSFVLIAIGLYIFYQEDLRQGYVAR